MEELSEKQRIFNRVYAHLLKQGRRAIGHITSACLYRAPNGDKCAAGCLIDDEYYSEELEHWGIDKETVKEALIKSGWTEFQLIVELQSVHDNVHPIEWAKQLRKIAYYHGLEIPNEPQ